MPLVVPPEESWPWSGSAELRHDCGMLIRRVQVLENALEKAGILGERWTRRADADIRMESEAIVDLVRLRNRVGELEAELEKLKGQGSAPH